MINLSQVVEIMQLSNVFVFLRRAGIILILLVPGIHKVKSQPWTELFNGKDLGEWKQLGGEAPFSVEGETITGTSIEKTPNSFLTTAKYYSDFILEFEIWVDPALNSGVQIRSNSVKSYRNGRVHGYQVEIDPSSRAFSGGIYDEARRGWLYPISRNTPAHSALRNGEWNKVHVEAIGNSIKTWINGIQCSWLIDDMTSTGFIGLQVHSIGNESQVGKKVKWRNIRILTKELEQYTWKTDPGVPQISYLKNTLTQWEMDKGWKLLWDGKTANGWRGAREENFPVSGWQIRDGELTILSTDGGESTGPGDIITTKNYSDFELELEFKITEGANSGIKYFVDPALNKGEGSAIGCEFQILDDEGHPDAKMGVGGNRTVGSLYDLIAAKNLSVPGRSKQFKGIGEWNKARIVSKEGNVEHWLNNEKVVEYNRFSHMFEALVAYSKYKIWDGFGQWPEGSILLQDHGDEVSFRSIKIREL